jgi:hypothetical protein
MALIDDFKTRFPEFDTSDVDTYLPGLESVYQCYHGATYGTAECDDEIILNLLAHLMVTSSLNSSTTPSQGVASESVGSVSVSYLTIPINSRNDVFFMSTKYGQMYLQLTAKNAGGYFV